MGQFVYTHTTWVDGGKKFGEKLAEFAGIEKVHAGPLTGRASHRPRIVIRTSETTLVVTLGVSNGHQEFFVHPAAGVGLADLRREVLNNCSNLGGYEIVDGDQKNGDGQAADAASDPRLQEAASIRFQFKLTVSEARAIVAVCDQNRGYLPGGDLEQGTRERIGANLWASLKNHKYIHSEGMGRGAVASLNPERFESTQFVVHAREGKFKERWSERPRSSWFDRPRGGWLEEVRKQIPQKEKPAAPEPEEPREDLWVAVRSLNSQLAQLARLKDSKRTALAGLEEQYQQLEEAIGFGKLEVEEIEKAENELRRKVEEIETLQKRLDGLLRPKP